MIQFINQYSTIWMAVFLMLGLALFFSRHKQNFNVKLALGLVFVGLVATWSILQPVQTPRMDSAKMVQSMIGQGKPVLLEFQSPY